jgi:leukotriene-A4 hydrolase
MSDPHSYSNSDEISLKHLDLNITVDFSAKKIFGKAKWFFKNKNNAKKIIFDTRGLFIENVTDENDFPLKFEMIDENIHWKGIGLEIFIDKAIDNLTIYYSTGEDAAALQWLEPQQTAGKDFPFLFTQSQSILARTWIPCHDSPAVRFTYSADVKVPDAMLALMSAENPREKNHDGFYHFKMEKPIPSYLMALAVGNISFKKIGRNTGVYAEPEVLEKSAWEFADMQKMVDAAENLYGEYRWGQYDVIVLPPSFPFGGMENPCITFATPTILSGDRSLVSLVAHELAHSWSGNLVTNATWNDFWLNEGFTVYFERRIDEALYGKDFADMEAELGFQKLVNVVDDLGKESPDTNLKLHLEGRDAYDGMTEIAYEKGFAFLLRIEKITGRERFDAFLKKYFSENAFQSMTTDKFLIYLNENLIRADANLFSDLNIEKWMNSPGIPNDAPRVKGKLFDDVDVELQAWISGKSANELKTQNWCTQQWLRFLQNFPEKLTEKQMNEFDEAFHFTDSQNAEIAAAWFLISIRNNYKKAFPNLEKFLNSVGRRKFILPLYKNLMKTDDGKILAKKIFNESKDNYHPVAKQSLEGIVNS